MVIKRQKKTRAAKAVVIRKGGRGLTDYTGHTAGKKNSPKNISPCQKGTACYEIDSPSKKTRAIGQTRATIEVLKVYHFLAK